MEWWEDPALDKVLWREGQKEWLRWRNGKASGKYVERRFAENYPASGEYEQGVKERAVWRVVEAEIKKKYRAGNRH